VVEVFSFHREGKIMDNRECRECRKCKQEKLITEFPSNGSKRQGKRWQCKQCMNKINKEYRASKRYKELLLESLSREKGVQ